MWLCQWKCVHSAGGYGGAMAIDGNGFTLTNITDTSFASNTAQTGITPTLQIAADGGTLTTDSSYHMQLTDHITCTD